MMQEISIQKEAKKIARTYIRKYYALKIILLITYAGCIIGFYVVHGQGSAFVAIVLGMFAILGIGWRFSISETEKINSILNFDCDPELYTEVYRALAASSIIRTRKVSMFIFIAYGLIMSGRFEDANTMLQPIDINRESSMLALGYYSVYTNCAEAFGRFDEIESVRIAVAEIKRKNKDTSAEGRAANAVLVIIDTFLAEHRADYDAAFALLHQFETEAKYPIQKVTCACRIARLLYLTGDYVQAKHRCEYVIQNGNKLYHVGRARELLKQCEEQLHVECGWQQS